MAIPGFQSLMLPILHLSGDQKEHSLREAKEFASRIDNKIILIDGSTLSQLMIDYNVGVNLVAAYELKRLDSDYFEE